VLLTAALLVRGAGQGAVTVPVMAAAYLELRREQIPHASSLTRILQQVGGAFGAAVLAVILQRQLAAHASASAGHAVAFGHTFWWSLGFTALAIVPASLLPGPIHAPAEPAGQPPIPE